MRLLDATTGQFAWFDDPRNVRYATLSHVWATEADPDFVPEQLYQEVVAIQLKPPSSDVLLHLSDKIQRACAVARQHGFRYIWIDTCCIDKTSSAELSEAINSMFDWYRYSKACYALLHDVDDEDDPGALNSQFCRSRWFKRGWTLQELIAPHNVLFLSKNWKLIGTKHRLGATVSHITGIDIAVLRQERMLPQVSVAQRMSWASERQTTREEDEAYCLIGVFNIHMTPIYGEGRYAFIRLQQAILKQIPDQSILAWGSRNSSLFFDKPTRPLLIPSVLLNAHQQSYLLATSPRDFSSSRDITAIPRESLEEELDLDLPYYEYTTTSYGIRASFPLIPCYDEAGSEYYLAFLACKDKSGRLVSLVLCPSNPRSSSAEMFVGTVAHQRGHMAIDFSRSYRTVPDILASYFRLSCLTPSQVRSCPTRANLTRVYIPHRPSRIQQALSRDFLIHNVLCASPPKEPPQITLAGWSEALLRTQGYEILDNTTEVLLHRDGESITIQVGHCTCQDTQTYGYLRAIVTASRDDTHTFPMTTRYEVSGIGRSACHEDHIYSWDIQNGVASKNFKLSTQRRASKNGRCLRLTLSLADPTTSSQRLYILDIDILDCVPEERTVSPDSQERDLAAYGPSSTRGRGTPVSFSSRTATRRPRTFSTRSRSLDASTERLSSYEWLGSAEATYDRPLGADPYQRPTRSRTYPSQRPLHRSHGSTAPPSHGSQITGWRPGDRTPTNTPASECSTVPTRSHSGVSLTISTDVRHTFNSQGRHSTAGDVNSSAHNEQQPELARHSPHHDSSRRERSPRYGPESGEPSPIHSDSRNGRSAPHGRRCSPPDDLDDRAPPRHPFLTHPLDNLVESPIADLRQLRPGILVDSSTPASRTVFAGTNVRDPAPPSPAIRNLRHLPHYAPGSNGITRSQIHQNAQADMEGLPSVVPQAVSYELDRTTSSFHPSGIVTRGRQRESDSGSSATARVASVPRGHLYRSPTSTGRDGDSEVQAAWNPPATGAGPGTVERNGSCPRSGLSLSAVEGLLLHSASTAHDTATLSLRDLTPTMDMYPEKTAVSYRSRRSEDSSRRDGDAASASRSDGGVQYGLRTDPGKRMPVKKQLIGVFMPKNWTGGLKWKKTSS